MFQMLDPLNIRNVNHTELAGGAAINLAWIKPDPSDTGPLER